MLKILLVFLALTISSAAHSADYIVHGLKGIYTPYYTSLISLSFNGEIVTGRLRPLNGDNFPEINVSGTNYAPGRLRLKIPLDGDLLEFDLEKTIDEYQVRWSTTNDDYVALTRPRNGPIPKAQKTLSVPFGCGTPYGFLTVALRKPHGASAISKIIGLNLSNSIWESSGYYGGNFTSPDTEHNVFDVKIPLGSEAYSAEKLRRDSRVFYADLSDGGGCGGSEVGYLTVANSLVSKGNDVDAMTFAELIEKKVSSYFRSFNSNSTVQTVELKRSILPPYPPQLKLSIVAPSSASRGGRATWDRFDMVFTTSRAIPNVPNDMTAIILWAERLNTGKREVLPESEPPRAEYIDTPLSYFDEATVAFMVARDLSSEITGDCEFFLQAFARSESDYAKLEDLPLGC